MNRFEIWLRGTFLYLRIKFVAQKNLIVMIKDIST